MNKTYITMAVLVLVVLGGSSFIFNSKKLEAPSGVICAQDAKLCPDGSYVSRTGLKCEFTACPESKVSQSVKEFTVTGKNFSFSPSLITVKKGDKVKITFVNTEGFHDFVIDEFGAATKQKQAPFTEVLEFTADQVGSFEYYCSVGSHRSMGMLGILKIE